MRTRRFGATTAPPDRPAPYPSINPLPFRALSRIHLRQAPELLGTRLACDEVAKLLREVLARDDATPEARKERAAALPVLLSVSIAAGSVAGTMAVATALLRLQEAETSLSPDTEAMLVALEPGLQRLAELYPTEARTLALALALASPISQTPNPRASWRPKQRSSLHGAGKVRSQRC